MGQEGKIKSHSSLDCRGITYYYSLLDQQILNYMTMDYEQKYKEALKRAKWKSSEEQMEALKKECIAHSNYQLCRLLEELEKL